VLEACVVLVGQDGRVVRPRQQALHGRQTRELRVLVPAEPGAVEGAQGALDDPVLGDGHDGVAAAQDGDELDGVGGRGAVEVGEEEVARPVGGGPGVDVEDEAEGGAGVAVGLGDGGEGGAVAG